MCSNATGLVGPVGHRCQCSCGTLHSRFESICGPWSSIRILWKDRIPLEDLVDEVSFILKDTFQSNGSRDAVRLQTTWNLTHACVTLKAIVFLPNRSNRFELFLACVGCASCRLETCMFVDKGQHARKSEWFLLEPVVYSARLDVDVATSVRRRSLS